MLYPGSVGARIPQLLDSMLANTATMVVPAVAVGTFQSRSLPVLPLDPILKMPSKASSHSYFYTPALFAKSPELPSDSIGDVAYIFQGAIFFASIEGLGRSTIGKWLLRRESEKTASEIPQSPWESSLMALRRATLLYQSSRGEDIFPMSETIDSVVSSLAMLGSPYTNVLAALLQEVKAEAFFARVRGVDAKINSLNASGYPSGYSYPLAEGESERDASDAYERIYGKLKGERESLIAKANQFQVEAANSWRLAAFKDLSEDVNRDKAFHRSCRGACVGKDFDLLARNYRDMASIIGGDEAIRYQLRSVWAYLKIDQPDYHGSLLAFRAAASVFQDSSLIHSSVPGEKVYELEELLREKMELSIADGLFA